MHKTFFFSKVLIKISQVTQLRNGGKSIFSFPVHCHLKYTYSAAYYYHQKIKGKKRRKRNQKKKNLPVTLGALANRWTSFGPPSRPLAPLSKVQPADRMRKPASSATDTITRIMAIGNSPTSTTSSNTRTTWQIKIQMHCSKCMSNDSLSAAAAQVLFFARLKCQTKKKKEKKKK